MTLVNSTQKITGIFQGCASCRKHCCLLRRKEIHMYLSISGKECEQIEALIGKTNNIKTMPSGKFIIELTEEGFCPFVDRQGCTLGELKPLPCKFYPYGILLKNNVYYLIRWTNVCKTFVDSNDQNEYNSLYELIYPWLEKRAFAYDEKDEGKFIIIQKVPEIYLNNMHFADAS